jgi:hypothetical protein
MVSGAIAESTGFKTGSRLQEMMKKADINMRKQLLCNAKTFIPLP